MAIQAGIDHRMHTIDHLEELWDLVLAVQDVRAVFRKNNPDHLFTRIVDTN